MSDHLSMELPGAHVVFTTRRGGMSRGPYASLNLGPGTDDDPAAVGENRARVARALGVELVGVRQVHGTRVVAAGTEEEADGVITRERGKAPTVLVADCLPVAIAATDGVAMVHCGWRGLAGGVVAAAVRALGGSTTAAAIGPGAGPCCYEVGEEVHAAFAGHGPDLRRGRNLDLKAIARRELETAGVGEIRDADVCTICGDPALWFSHRRDGGVTGRQAGIAWLT